MCLNTKRNREIQVNLYESENLWTLVQLLYNCEPLTQLIMLGLLELVFL